MNSYVNYSTLSKAHTDLTLRYRLLLWIEKKLTEMLITEEIRRGKKRAKKYAKIVNASESPQCNWLPIEVGPQDEPIPKCCANSNLPLDYNEVLDKLSSACEPPKHEAVPQTEVQEISEGRREPNEIDIRILNTKNEVEKTMTLIYEK